MAENDVDVSDRDTTQIEETNEGVVIEVSLTRGTGTYDKDFVKGTLEKESLEEVEKEIDQFRETLKDQAEWSREIQPQMGIDEIVELAEEKEITDELFRALHHLPEEGDE